MVFNLNEYTGDDDRMHCDTEEKAKNFLKFLHENGRTWCSGNSYLEFTNYGKYGFETSYYFNEGTFGDKVSEFGVLLEYDDFDWGEPVNTPSGLISFDEMLQEVNKTTI